jgi:hypothetical protein
VNNYGKILPTIALGLGFLAAPLAHAQSSGSPPTGMNNPSAPDNNMKATAPSNSFSGWASDYSKAHQGRISRQAYMDEAGRRWDALDKNNQGLTSEQVGQMYGWSSTGGNNSMNKDNKGK